MLKFLGIGDLNNVVLGNTSAYIKDDNGNMLLIDCGTTIFQSINELELLNDVKNLYVVITHMHPDHVAGLGSLIFSAKIYHEIVPQLILTTDDTSEKMQDDLQNFLSLQGLSEDDYEFLYADMTEQILSGLVSLDLVPINHTEDLFSCAVEIKFEDRTIYYTGDHKDAEYVKQVVEKLDKKDVLYTDCTDIESETIPHISLNMLDEIVPKEKKKYVYCMHFNSIDAVDKAMEMNFKIAEKYEVEESNIKYSEFMSEVIKKDLLRKMLGR